MRVTFVGEDGRHLYAEDRRATALVWFGGDAPIAQSRTVVLETVYTPETTGEIQLGFAGANAGRLFLDGALVLDDTPVLAGTDLGAAFLNPPSLTVAVRTEAGREIAVRAEFTRNDEAGIPAR